MAVALMLSWAPTATLQQTCESCDQSYYNTCKPECEALPSGTEEERNARTQCFSTCRSTHLGCSASCEPEGGPYSPPCPSSGACMSYYNNCYTQCQAEMYECYSECGSDSQCVDICISVRNGCGSMCNATYMECMYCNW